VSVEFETVAIDHAVAADILNKAAFLGREMLCQVQITALTKKRWHVGIKCPTVGGVVGGGAVTLSQAWEMATEEWFSELQKKVPGITRERVGL
jgi:hypothetical protein